MHFNNDYALYAVHGAFWAAFGITRAILGALDNGVVSPPAGIPASKDERTAPHSRALVGFHMVAFGVMYFGVGDSVIGDRVPEWFGGQRWIGTGVIAGGATLMCWTLVYFRSWRFQAKIDEGHQLATQGPFRFLRHPI